MQSSLSMPEEQQTRTHAIQGLSASEAKERLERFGPNALVEDGREALWLKVVKQFKSPLIYILLFALTFDLVAWLVEGAEGHPLESIAIAAILVLNAVLGVRQEFRAEAALDRLKDLAAPQSWVMRDGSLVHLSVSELVPDDVVRLEAGDRVPADGNVIQGLGLSVDESMLTGESVAVDKNLDDELFSGTLLSRGQGFFKVSRTGSESTLGKLAHLLSSLEMEKTPLELRLERFSSQIARWIIGLALVLVVAGIFYEGVEHFSEVFLFAVALAVAAIPEGLPAVLTTTLALGTERMAKQKAVVRRLSAVEALGSVTVIATDKTGTLTENKMKVHTIDAADFKLALKTMTLASEADLDSGAGDPIELGLLEYAKKNGTDPTQLRDESVVLSTRPFDSEWKFMRVTVKEADRLKSYFKGAPEVLLERSSLAEHQKQSWLEKITAYGYEGHRTLALAYGEGEEESALTFLGLVLLHDPARQEVPEAIQRAQNAGIRIIMMTGDHPATAMSIANSVGIQSDRVLVGSELDAMSSEQLTQALKETNILARVSPEHKLSVVEALKENGEIVAVTGDGVNDAPALKRSHVGIAMGQRGSDVTKEVADLVLLDDNFATLVAAIEEGRSIYTNIQKFIRFLFATNLSEVLVIVFGVILAVIFDWRGLDGSLILPLTAVQILWINLVTDALPALGLALDENASTMHVPPREPSSPLLDRLSLWFVSISAIILSIACLGFFWYSAQQGQLDEGRSATFYILVFGQLLYVFGTRKLDGNAKFNSFLTIVFLLSLSLQIAINYLRPLQKMLELSPLSNEVFLIVLGLSFAAGLSTFLFSLVLRQLRKPIG